MIIEVPLGLNLKKCAFCGGDPTYYAIDHDDRSVTLYINCTQCDMQSGHSLASSAYTPINWELAKEAEHIWNRRYVDPEIIEAVRHALQALVNEFGWGLNHTKDLAIALDKLEGKR